MVKTFKFSNFFNLCLWFFIGAGFLLSAGCKLSGESFKKFEGIAVTTYSPQEGVPTGGETLTIEGSGFFPETEVYIDNTLCESLTLISPKKLTCVMPSHATGKVNLLVSSPNAEDSLTTDAYYYKSTHLAIVDPMDSTQGVDTTITLQAQDVWGNKDAYFNGTVTLNSDGDSLIDSSSQTEIITLTNGEGTATLSNTSIETVNLSLTDSGGTGLDVTSTQNVNFDFLNEYSILFDGVDDYTQAGALDTLLGGGTINNFSMSYWLKMNTPPVDWDGIWGATTDGIGWADLFGAYWLSGKVTYNLGGVAISTSAFTPGQWNHLVLTIDTAHPTDNFVLYINGVKDTVRTDATIPAITSGNIEFGRILGDGASLNDWNIDGYIDEVAFWSNTLTEAEVIDIYGLGQPYDLKNNQGDYVSASSLISYWHMGDVATPTTINDEVATEDLSNANSPTYQPDIP